MKWKTVEEEIPPIGEKILIGWKGYENLREFNWQTAVVIRPFYQDKKYNPDYYYFRRDSQEVTLGLHMYWMRIEKPDMKE